MTAARILGPTTTVREYAVGRAHARVNNAVIIILSLLGAGFAVTLLTGRILIPGFLVIALLVEQVRPARAVVVTDRGLVVLQRNLFNGRPTKVLASLSHLAVAPNWAEARGARIRTTLGNDVVTFKGPDFDRLSAAAATAAAAGAAPRH